MRLIICFVVVLSFVLCAGCANQEPAPADPAPAAEAPAADTDPIATEDFESGEAEDLVIGEEEAEEEQVEGDAH